MKSVVLDPISWDAIATFLTGLFAVGGAVVVGIRQTKILSDQVAASRQTNQIALFEKRYEIYQSIEQFIREIMATGGKASKEAEMDFSRSRGKARFIFSTDVSSELKELWTDYCDMSLGQDLMRDSMAETGTNGPDNVKKKHDALKRIVLRAERLPDIFAEIRPHHSDEIH